jgi:hypothetical protein
MAETEFKLTKDKTIDNSTIWLPVTTTFLVIFMPVCSLDFIPLSAKFGWIEEFEDELEKTKEDQQYILFKEKVKKRGT